MSALTHTEAQIRDWALAEFDGVDDDDVRSRGNDAPIAHITERTYTARQVEAFGEWGCVREWRWCSRHRGRGGAVVTPTNEERAAAFADHVVRFVARNGRVRLSIVGTLLNGMRTKTLVVAPVNMGPLGEPISAREVA